MQKIEALETRLYASPMHKHPSLETLYGLCQQKAEVRSECSSGLASIIELSGEFHLMVYNNYCQTAVYNNVELIVSSHVSHLVSAIGRVCVMYVCQPGYQ